MKFAEAEPIQTLFSNVQWKGMQYNLNSTIVCLSDKRGKHCCSLTALLCEVLFVDFVPGLYALLGAEQERGLPLVQPSHAVELCYGVCEFVDVSAFESLSQIL